LCTFLKPALYPNRITFSTITFLTWGDSPPPPHFHTNVRVLLNRVIPQCLNGRAANGDTTFSFGHPVRRILHHAISFFWGSLNTAFMFHRCQVLRDALQGITADMLHRVWDEFDYRVDVCQATQGVITNEKLGHFPLLTVYVVPRVGLEINV
jgi:hypothetical protein